MDSCTIAGIIGILGTTLGYFLGYYNGLRDGIKMSKNSVKKALIEIGLDIKDSENA